MSRFMQSLWLAGVVDSGARCPGGGSAATPARAPGLRSVVMGIYRLSCNCVGQWRVQRILLLFAQLVPTSEDFVAGPIYSGPQKADQDSRFLSLWRVVLLGLLRNCHSSGSSHFTAFHGTSLSSCGGPGVLAAGDVPLAPLSHRPANPGGCLPIPGCVPGIVVSQQLGPAFQSPSQFTAGPRHAAHPAWVCGGAVPRGMPLFWFLGLQISPGGTPPSRQSGPGHRAPTRGPAFLPRLSFPSGWNPRGTPLKAPRAPRRLSARAPAQPTPPQSAAGTSLTSLGDPEGLRRRGLPFSGSHAARADLGGSRLPGGSDAAAPGQRHQVCVRRSRGHQGLRLWARVAPPHQFTGLAP
ncbi:hypothetical protein NDU88_003216 [Pleurodeles waltl]|uniref:Uncharacterized protein n=1 Tax=Pleurodeles waltl TaxID=8319 RepID=A0AAV7NFZ5_PLEWA|nr:hypothetical protein NDU88_003216 [Pleurodeles waltl]